MAWQVTKRHQEGLWRCWVLAMACVVGLVLGGQEARAQMGSAPFVFEGEMLRITTPGWKSTAHFIIAEPANIEVQHGVEAHIGGNIEAAPGSPHGMTKLGGGVLRLSGANTYRGSTRVLQGGLHLDGPSVFGGLGGLEAIRGTQLEYSSGVTMHRPLTLSGSAIEQLLPGSAYTPVAPMPGLDTEVGWRVESGTAVHAGLLQGAAPFAKLGAGRLDITGDAMAYTGQARVAQGVLAINEIFSGQVRVQSGARLQGAGSLAGLQVESGGVLAPGNGWAGEGGLGTSSAGGTAAGQGSIAGGLAAGPTGGTAVGTLFITGDVRFDSGSRFEIDALPTGQADFVWVGGKAALDGEVAVLAHEGLWSTSVSYPILTVQGGFDETQFASVSSNLAFLTPSLSYGADTVTLTLQRNNVPIEEVGETPDEEEVGKVIDEVVQPGVDPAPKANPDLHERVAVLDRGAAREALNQLSGSWHPSVLSSVWNDSRFLREAVLRQSHLGRVTHKAVMQKAVAQKAGQITDKSDSAAFKLRSWAEAFHSDLQRDGMGGVPTDTRRVDGVVLGIAAAAKAAWQAGAYLGFQESRLGRDEGAAQADISSTHLGMHLAAHVGAIRLTLGAARSWHRLKTQRMVNAGSLRDALGARYRGATTQLFGEAAWPLFETTWPAGTTRGVDNLHSVDSELDAKWSGADENRVSKVERGEAASPGQIRVSVSPFAQFAWVRTNLNGFTETGGSAALRAQPSTLKGWVSAVGMRAEASLSDPKYGADAAKLFVQAAWRHANHSKAESTQAFRDSLTQTAFTTQGLAPVRQAWSLQVGMDAKVGKTGSVGFAYLGQFGRHSNDQGIGGWARIMF